MMENYIIDFDIFETAMIFTSCADVRYYLNGVHLCGSRVESSNGHIGYMANFDKSKLIPENVSGSRSLPDIIVRPKNKIPTKNKKNWFCYVSISLGDIPRIDYLDFRGETLATDVIEIIIDGKFPNMPKLFQGVIKKERTNEWFGVNADYLAVFQKALKREAYKTIKFHPKSQNDAILVTFDRIHLRDVKERAVIMPVRI